MKSIIIQNAIRRRRQQIERSEPEGRDIENAANAVVGIIFVVLIVLIVGSVAFVN